MGGNWKVENGRAVETRGFAVNWGYHELMNYNGLVTQGAASDFTEIRCRFALTDVKKNPEGVLAFALNSPQQHYYYNFFAVKLTGDNAIMRRASLIRSTPKDESLPVTVKNNYTIETLCSGDCPLIFGRDYELRVVHSRNTLSVYMENTLLFTYRLPLSNLKGKFAVAARGVCISVDSIRIMNGKKEVFADNFDKYSIYVPTVKAVRIDKK